MRRSRWARLPRVVPHLPEVAPVPALAHRSGQLYGLAVGDGVTAVPRVFIELFRRLRGEVWEATMNARPASSRAPEIGRREHSGIGHDDHVGHCMELLHGGNDRDQDSGLGLVALEDVDIQREPVPSDQSSAGNLWVDAALNAHGLDLVPRWRPTRSGRRGSRTSNLPSHPQPTRLVWKNRQFHLCPRRWGRLYGLAHTTLSQVGYLRQHVQLRHKRGPALGLERCSRSARARPAGRDPGSSGAGPFPTHSTRAAVAYSVGFSITGPMRRFPRDLPRGRVGTGIDSLQ